MSDRKAFSPRSAYAYQTTLATRWSDNDVYGHVNNVAYYSYFDTVVNGMLIARGLLDIEDGDVIGLVVETGCSYAASVAYPDTLWAGVRVARLGTSSVTYQVAIGRADAPDGLVAAQGHFTHVYVDRTTRRPVPIAGTMRAALIELVNNP